METRPTILLTGGTGYVGGRLIPLLEQHGVKLRCMVRRPENLASRVSSTTEVVQGDVLNRDSLAEALQGIHTAYYLVHSMGGGQDFANADRQGAQNFADAARQAGVKRIIYLGGLGNSDEQLSKHLRSRQEVGEILASSEAQVVEFRASIIIGSGSLSFELVRALVNKLPVMVWPKWVSTLATPIAIEDVLSYLTAILDHAIDENKVYEIGGPDQVSYGGIMMEYARQRGLRRVTIPVPFLSPRLSSLWLGLVTPVYARIGRQLIESLRNPTVVNDGAAIADFEIRPRGLSEAIDRALRQEDNEIAQTRWSDALSSAGQRQPWGGVRFGNRLVDSRTHSIDAPAEVAFQPIQRIGGRTGWYYANWLWSIRGFLDLLVGGVGLRRGRRDPVQIAVGDTIDCWRVEAFEPNRRLRLSAEMKLPGRAWLEFEVTEEQQGSMIRQTAIFDPIGLWGRAYWYGIWPLHELIFAGMLKSIGAAATKSDTPSQPYSRPQPVLLAQSNEKPANKISSGWSSL